MSSILASDEIQPIVEKLVEEFAVSLPDVDPARFIYVKGKGKRRPVTIKSVPEPFDLVMSHRFVLTVHGPKFDPLTEDKKALAIFDELLRIKDFDTGKLQPHAVVGNKEVLETWGLDWLEADTIDPVFNRGTGKKQA